MADRIPAEIWLGGKIAATLVPGLCAAISDAGVSLAWGDAQFHPADADNLTNALVDSADGVPLLWLCDDEASWGEFDGLEKFLEEQRISFTRQSEGRYEYEPERVEFRPGAGKVCLATDRSGEPVVRAAELGDLEGALTKTLQLVQGGQTKRATSALRTAIKKLRWALPPSVPPLEPFEIVAAREPHPPK
jgi:hypothetical protein